jgi:NADH-quinone oxidoreductase subunit N
VAVLLRFFTAILPADIWLPIVILVSALTMTVGNLVALAQTNIKRMLAYSSIAQAGYMLMGFAALGSGSGTGLWQVYSVPIYLATYVFMNLGVIAVVVAVYENRRSHQIADYAGLARSAPGLAWLMVFFLLSLAGIPPTAGFFGKLGLFYAAIENRLYWLAILAFIMSVISVYYYFGVIKAMFFTTEGEMQPVRSGFGVKAALAISLIGTLGIFLFAQPFLAIVGTMQP